MKLGFIARNDLAGIEEDARFAVQHGFRGLEFNYWGTFPQLTEETVGKMRTVLDQHGVPASALGLWGWNHLDPDAEKRADSHAQLNRAIDFARMLGAEILIAGGGEMPEATPEQNAAEFVNTFPPFLERAKDAGLKVAFYPVHGNSFFKGTEDFQRVWEHLPDVGIKLDPANIRHHGDDYLKLLRDHGDKVYHVHIKEHLYVDGKLASQPAAGMGDIEWGKVMAFLYEKGYGGHLSIEPHGAVWGRPPLRNTMLLLTKRTIDPFLL